MVLVSSASMLGLLVLKVTNDESPTSGLVLDRYPERKRIFSVVCLIFLRSKKHTTKTKRMLIDNTATTAVPFESLFSGFETEKLVVDITDSLLSSSESTEGAKIVGDVGKARGVESVVTLKVSENSEPTETFTLNT